jgi:hypothetical protein
VWLQPGAVSSISVPVADRHATLHIVKGMFDFATALEYPDRRHAAAKLVGVSVGGANGERRRYRVAGPESGASPALSLVPV